MSACIFDCVCAECPVCISSAAEFMCVVPGKNVFVCVWGFGLMDDLTAVCTGSWECGRCLWKMIPLSHLQPLLLSVQSLYRKGGRSRGGWEVYSLIRLFSQLFFSWTPPAIATVTTAPQVQEYSPYSTPALKLKSQLDHSWCIDSCKWTDLDTYSNSLKLRLFIVGYLGAASC